MNKVSGSCLCGELSFTAQLPTLWVAQQAWIHLADDLPKKNKARNAGLSSKQCLYFLLRNRYQGNLNTTIICTARFCVIGIHWA